MKAEQIDELVVEYRRGAFLVELAERFGIHKRTAAAHLVRCGVPLRRKSLRDDHVPGAAKLYESGMSLAEVARRFGVSDQAVRRVIATVGVTIRLRRGGRKKATVYEDWSLRPLRRPASRSGACR